MPRQRLQICVPFDVAARVRARAKACGMSVSACLADIVTRDAGHGWPRGFFEEVVGGWKGRPLLLRPPQGRLEHRAKL